MIGVSEIGRNDPKAVEQYCADRGNTITVSQYTTLLRLQDDFDAVKKLLDEIGVIVVADA